MIDDSARVGRIAPPVPVSGAPLRRLALAVAIASVVGATALPADSAIAASLGRLVVQSALGQPLRAEIEIAAASPEEADSLSARIPGADAFRRAGLEPPPAAAGVRAFVERRADGQVVVRLVSGVPLQEPFVALLVELAGSGGRLQREYSIVVDPPDARPAAAGRGEAVVPPQAGAAPVAPVPSTAAGAAGGSGGAGGAGGVAPGRPDDTSRSSGRTPSIVMAVRPGGQYDVRDGESLADIAQAVRPEGATVVQVMVAIYRANPDAFGGSMHHLLKGSRLRLPTPDEIAQVDVLQARRELRLQTADFLGERARLASEPRLLDGTPAGRAASGSIGARIDEGARADALDRLRLSRAGDEAARGTGSRVGERADAVAGRAERDAARDAAISELTSRLRDLEKNVLNMQKLLELRDRQLAELQAVIDRAREAGRVVTGSVGPGPTADPATGSTPGPVQDGGAAATAPAVKPGGTTASAPPGAPEASGGPTAPATAAGPAPAPQPRSSGWVLPALGTAALVLGTALLLVLRRRRDAAGAEAWPDDEPAGDRDRADAPGGLLRGPGPERAGDGPSSPPVATDATDVVARGAAEPGRPAAVDDDRPEPEAGVGADDAPGRGRDGGRVTAGAAPGPEIFDSVPDLSGFAGLGGPRDAGRTPSWLDANLPDDAPSAAPAADGIPEPSAPDAARGARLPTLPPLDLGGIDLSLPAASDGTPTGARAADADAESPRADAPVDAEPAAADVAAVTPDAGTAPDDSARWQEMATKLELAAAYEEIGDRDGARELLEEVIAGGLPSQQQRASERLGQLR